jgi:hypothetical protein
LIRPKSDDVDRLRAINQKWSAFLARSTAMIAREDACIERFATYVARRDAWYAQRDKSPAEEGLMFKLTFDGHPVVIANTIKGACFAAAQIADILGCDRADLSSTPALFLDDVLSQSLNYGATGAQLRKWLKKTIRPSKRRIRPEIIEQGLLIYDLTPVRSPTGTLIRLKEQVMITPKGIAEQEREGAVVH